MSQGTPRHLLIGMLAEWAHTTGEMADVAPAERGSLCLAAADAAYPILTGRPPDDDGRMLASWALSELRRFAREHAPGPDDEDGCWAGSGADHAAFLYALLDSCRIQ